MGGIYFHIVPYIKRSMTRYIITIGVGLFILSATVSAALSDSRLLLNQYRQFSATTKPLDRNLALRIQSDEQGRRLRVDVYGIVNQPYPRVAEALSSPAAMCDFLILNMNVKTCTYEQVGRRLFMTIYIAGKNYAPLYRTLEIEPYFELQKKDRNYLKVLVASREASRGKTEYSVFVEAVPYGKATLVRFSSKYFASRINKAATTAYLKTFALNKVGFTVIGRNNQGLPEYVRGMQGVIERNAVRSYLALQAYLETTDAPVNLRFESRLWRWFKLTNVYKRQLHEMHWQSYLLNKRREYQNQLMMQKQILRRVSKRGLQQRLKSGG